MRRVHEMPFGVVLEEDGGWCFRLWAPAASNVEVLIGAGSQQRVLPMEARAAGWWERGKQFVVVGESYCYRINGEQCVPDPAARAQYDDVHGPSIIVDPSAFSWHDEHWSGRPWAETVIYEVHVGSFTTSGTFRAVVDRLDHLVSLGITALELMPVSDFPGMHGWGYDGVLPFAPDRRYGTPEDLKTLIQEAHERGLMVLLDVVYNHFGPEGNYLHLYAPDFFTERHKTPWGDALNFGGERSRTVRDFFIHNALYWLEEFHFDGLRFDAAHAIVDDSRPDIIEEIAARVRALYPGRHVHLVLENERNEAHYLRSRGKQSAYDAQWNDDFHHCLHVIITGEEGGYYSDFAAEPHELLARVLKDGFAFQGDNSAYHGAPRGEPSRDLSVTSFVNFLQNHDQVGNRAFGERISLLAEPEAVRATTALLLLTPAPPLIFMGQEWGSTQPFPFFCDFGPELAGKISAGRRQEFARFDAFQDPELLARIPDPESQETFRHAVLRWEDSDTPSGLKWLELHRQLLDVRKREIVPRLSGVTGLHARAVHFGDGAIAARWRLGDGMVLMLVANLCGDELADVELPKQGTIFETPGFRDANDTILGWSTACFITTAHHATLRLHDQRVLK